MKAKKIWPFIYLANRKTKEIHRVKHIVNACGIRNMQPHNARYGTALWAWYLIRFRGYNGCRFCLAEKDTG